MLFSPVKQKLSKYFNFCCLWEIFAVLLQYRIGFVTVCRTIANLTNHWAQEVSLNRNWEILGKKFAWQTLVKYTLLWIKTWPEPLVSPWLGYNLQASISPSTSTTLGVACVSPTWLKSATIVLQEADLLTLKKLNGYYFWKKLSICCRLNWMVALARLGTGWFLCSPTEKDCKVTMDKMLKVSWHCEHSKLSAGMHYEELGQQIDIFFCPLVPSPLSSRRLWSS